VTTGVVIRSILLSVDDGLRVLKGAVTSGTDRVTHGWLEINHDSTRDVLSALGLREEGVEGSVLNSWGFIARHGTFLGDAMLKAVKLPAAVTYGQTGLSNVKRE